jgi:ABC-type transport system substrate-binding protein
VANLGAGDWSLVHRPRIFLVVAATAVLLAGCGSDEATQTTTSSGEPPSTTTLTTTSATSPEAASPLEGTWRTDPITRRDVEGTLRRYGLEKWIKRFQTVTPIPATTVLILDIREGEWDLYGKATGEPRVEIDYDAGYAVRGDEVDKVHATGATTYRWSVDGDTLTLEWLRSTEPPSEGIPDEVFSRVLYMTRDFERQG